MSRVLTIPRPVIVPCRAGGSSIVLAAVLFLCAVKMPAQPGPVDSINPLVGTANAGQTFPGVGVPFGMTAWTPATNSTEKKGIAPYYFKDTAIQGFRGSHFLSGSATQEYGSFQLLAGRGRPDWSGQAPQSQFVRASETATPYRYDVELPQLGVQASMTATSRAGLLRFRFPAGGPAWISVQDNARPGDGSTTIDPVHNEITGRDIVRRLYAGNGKPAGFAGYVVVQFDHPFHLGGTWSGKAMHPGSLAQPADDSPSGAYVTFDVKPGESVQARIGTSFVSVEQARQNLQAEIPAWNFEAVAAASRAAWNNALGRLQVDGEENDRRVFYTALYHGFQLPRAFSDVSGSYPEFAGGRSTQLAKGFTYYDDFSLWDTFRALHPLLTIIDSRRDAQMIQSLIEKGKEGGFLPIFPAWNSYTSEMVGDHATAVIGDAILKGIPGFDLERTYQLMRRNAFDSPQDSAEYRDGKGRRALQSYLQYGYVPLEDTVPGAFHKNEQVSRTLEYAYDDFVLAEVAKSLGKADDERILRTRAANYRNVIDPETKYARGRHADGSWVTPFDPGKPASYITEGLPSQYTFFVPQDLGGLIALEGGDKAFVGRLDDLFAKDQYDHGNEPSHSITYLYDYAGAAAKTQEHVAAIRKAWYKDSPDGLAGNDDAGQMSAWFVFSALGFYPVTPGIPAYALGTPLFRRAVLHLENGRSFQVTAHNVSARNIYIRSVTLNGKPLNRFWIRHTEIMAGGELVFEMSAEPAQSWPSDHTLPS